MNKDTSWKSLLRHGLELSPCAFSIYIALFSLYSAVWYLSATLWQDQWRQRHKIEGRIVEIDKFYRLLGGMVSSSTHKFPSGHRFAITGVSMMDGWEIIGYHVLHNGIAKKKKRRRRFRGRPWSNVMSCWYTLDEHGP